MGVKDGVYATTLRDGQTLIVQYVQGRPVEVMYARTNRRPKRRTTRRLGDSITAVVRAAEERRRLLEVARWL